MSKLSLYFKGILMGISDIIPGVSGATMALITGIYPSFVKAISSLDFALLKSALKFDIKAVKEKIDLSFILPLAAGLVTSLLLFSRFVHYLLLHHEVYLWSFFFGLILASSYLLSQSIQWRFKNLVFILSGVTLGLSFSMLKSLSFETSHLVLFFSGIVAISAMMLPGISGSFVLVLLGQYHYVTGALKGLTAGDADYIGLLIFSSGCLSGLIFFSKLLKFLLENYEVQVYSLMTGVVMGSMIKLWPWKSEGSFYVVPKWPFEIETHEMSLSLFWMISGLLSIFILSFYSKKMSHTVVDLKA